MTFVRQGGAGLLQLAHIATVARFAGVEGVGHYTVAIFVAQLFSLVFSLGIAPALVFYVAKREIAPLPAAKVAIYVSILATLLSWLVLTPLFLWSAHIFPSLPDTVYVPVFAAIPFLLANSYFLAILQGKQDFKGYNAGLLITPFLAVAFTVFVAVYGRLTGTISVYVWSGAHAITSVYLILRLLKHGKESLVRSESRDSVIYILKLLKFGWKAHIANASSFMIYRTDIYLINMFLGSAAVGIYAISVQIAEKLWMISTAVSTVFFPKITESSGSSKQDTISETVIAGAQAVLLSTMIVAGIVCYFSELIVVLFFGNEYSSGVLSLRILLFGAAFFGAARVFAISITAAGYPNITMLIAIGLLLVNIVGNFVLIPHFGIAGASAATATTYLLATIANAAAFFAIFRCRVSLILSTVRLRAVVRQTLSATKLVR